MQSEERIIKVIVAEDHPLFLDGLRLAFKKLKKQNIDLIGEAVNGQELLEQTQLLNPDIVVTDIQMPIMDGIQASFMLVQKDTY
jgi:YesN/AraC family two-component response regulator